MAVKYTLGDLTIEIDAGGDFIIKKNGLVKVICHDPKPHEAYKIAKAKEDFIRLREFGEDSNHIA